MHHTASVIEVRRLTKDDVALVAEIDRSEHIEVEYEVKHGRLVERPVTMSEVPPWATVGDGEHTVAHYIASCTALVADGGILLGAFDGTEVAGLAIVDPDFEDGRAWLAFLHVSRPHRRRGAARALWAAAAELGRDSGARSMYVSATPTGSAVGFYLSQGCRLADPVHPALFAMEPDDIHLVCAL